MTPGTNTHLPKPFLGELITNCDGNCSAHIGTHKQQGDSHTVTYTKYQVENPGTDQAFIDDNLALARTNWGWQQDGVTANERLLSIRSK